jgi:UDP-N-acetylglucosamine 2-epimerase (non-hydrolysing)
MKKLLIVFGTRPEAVKLAPLVHAIRRERRQFRLSVCVTGQHRGMLKQVLDFFDIRPDHDLKIMRTQQDPFDITAACVRRMRPVLLEEKPDLVVVQGDTTTTFAAALSSYYLKIPVAHVEAGLRTRDKFHPHPEELSRKMTTCLSDIHFAPTKPARENLLKEGVPSESIFITGNTVVDALLMALEVIESSGSPQIEKTKAFCRSILGDGEKRLILITGHRRENLGERLKNICLAVKEIASRNPDLQLVYPVHLNPEVRKSVAQWMGGVPNVHLLRPLDYGCFVFMMSRCYLILTDSGGIQEEAPTLKKPVLLMRDATERPEAVKAGAVRLVGADRGRIVREAQRLLDDEEEYARMTTGRNPFGDGQACIRILDVLRKGSVSCGKPVTRAS